MACLRNFANLFVRQTGGQRGKEKKRARARISRIWAHPTISVAYSHLLGGFALSEIKGWFRQASADGIPVDFEGGVTTMPDIP